jgi:hypothetical protein
MQKTRWLLLSGLMMPLCSLLMSCATYNQGAGCVTYNRYRPTVSAHDSSETMLEIDKLDRAMEAACLQA